MKCVECVDYAECSKKYNLTIKRKHCPMAKVEYVQTNADRIRAMSDEELAVFVRAVVIADGCPNGDVDCKECPVFAICNQSGLYGHEVEWLKQPAEVIANG